MAMAIIKSVTVRDGIRVIIGKRCDGYGVALQEHESICGGYVSDADADGWRTCLLSFEYSLEEAEAELDRLVERAKQWRG